MKARNQISLFGPLPYLPPAGSIAVPPVIEQALAAGAALAISISGGKDSQALLAELVPWFRARGFAGQLFAIHADLGRAEWPQTAEFVQELAARYDVPLIVVRRTAGDLVARIEQRLATLAGTGKPFWPSSEQRYCTSHLKAGPIDTALRNPAPFWPSSKERYCTSDNKRGPIDTSLRAITTCTVIISAEGVRADESPKRAKKPFVEVRPSITAGSKDPARDLATMTAEAAIAAQLPGQRVALNWRPLLHYTAAQVWEACGTTTQELQRRQALHRAGQEQEAQLGWVGHPAYVLGNQRLSCALCVFGSDNDLLNGAHANPELYAHFIELEIIGQATFKHGQSLAQLPVTGRAAELRDAVLAGTLTTI